MDWDCTGYVLNLGERCPCLWCYLALMYYSLGLELPLELVRTVITIVSVGQLALLVCM